MQASATVTSKGQVTIPVEVRKSLALKDGDKIEFVQDGDGRWIMQALNASIDGALGLLKHKGPPLSVEEMDEGIGQAICEDMDRINRQSRLPSRSKHRA
jgi:antitoxin PrlF